MIPKHVCIHIHSHTHTHTPLHYIGLPHTHRHTNTHTHIDTHIHIDTHRHTKTHRHSHRHMHAAECSETSPASRALGLGPLSSPCCPVAVLPSGPSALVSTAFLGQEQSEGAGEPDRLSSLGCGLIVSCNIIYLHLPFHNNFVRSLVFILSRNLF